MDGNITAVFGAAFCVFILIYLGTNLDRQHFFLKIGLMLMAVFMLILVPKAVIDANTICTHEVMNITDSGNLTTLDYEMVCTQRSFKTGTTMMVGIMLIVTLIMMYVFVYILKEVFERFGKIYKE